MWTLEIKTLGIASRVTVQDEAGKVVRSYYSTSAEMIERTADQWAWLFGIQR